MNPQIQHSEVRKNQQGDSLSSHEQKEGITFKIDVTNHCALADLRERQGRPPRVQILSISGSFWYSF